MTPHGHPFQRFHWAGRVIALCLAMPLGWAKPACCQTPMLADPNLNLYHGDTSLCGIAALYQSLRAMDRPVSLDEICANVPIQHGASSLADMCAFLDARGVEYVVLKEADLTPALSLLKPHQRVAILHTDSGSHFVTAILSSSGQLRLLDGQDVIADNPWAVASRRFSGTAVVIGKNVRFGLAAAHIRRVSRFAIPAVVLGLITGCLLAWVWPDRPARRAGTTKTF